jgi:hypothetical protein
MEGRNVTRAQHLHGLLVQHLAEVPRLVNRPHGLKNQLKISRFFTKTGETGHRLSVNWTVNLKKIKNEIKISKKTRTDFKIFDQNRIKKFEVIQPTKIDKAETKGKLRRKKETTCSL